MADPWAVVGETPVSGGGSAHATDPWAVVDQQPVGPVASQFGGAPSTEPQLDTAAPASIGDRFRINAREGFDGTLAGEVVNRVQSGQVAQTQADDLFRAIVEARQAGSPVGLDVYAPTAADKASKFPLLHQPQPNPYAEVPLAQLEQQFNAASRDAAARANVFDAQRQQEQAEYQALPSFTKAETVPDKILQGATAFAGELAGGFASPENLIGGPGKRAAVKVGENIVERVAREMAPGVVAGASGSAVAAPVVAASKAERGEGDGLTGQGMAESVALGAAVGGAFHIPGILARPILERIAARRGVPVDKLDPASVGQTEAAEAIADPQIAALAKANGIDTANDPRVAQLQAVIERRRGEEALRTPDQPAGSLKAQDAEILRRQNEVQGVKDGQIDPAATNVQRRAPDETPIRVDSQGGAFREEPGTLAGRQKAEILGAADQRRLPAPGREVLTDEEIARQRAATEGGQRPDVETPPRLVGGEDSLPRDAAGVEQTRQAGEAFDLAQRQRDRAGADVRDTQTAGRPEGANPQTVHLDEGHPVEIINRRMVPDARGRMTEVATVRRTDPRTGKPEAGSIEYDVPVRQLKTGEYAVEPRMAQDFEARARVESGPAGRIDEAQGLPRQTYRTTPPDDNAAGTARAARPEQPEGPHPGPRWSTTEEAMRDFADRQARGEANGPAGDQYKGQKTSSKAGKPDRDGRFTVDENGYVVSDKGGPVKYADQKQAAKWIINEGHKKSPDQIFEIANHPSGGGFTVRERGRTEAPKSGGEGPKPGAAATADAGPQRQLNGPRDEAPAATVQEREAALLARGRNPQPTIPRTFNETPEQLAAESAKWQSVFDEHVAQGMSGRAATVAANEAVPLRTGQRYIGTDVEAPSTPVGTTRAKQAEIERQALSGREPLQPYADAVSAERERLWAQEMPGYKRDGGRLKDGTASQAVANGRMVDASARETVMRREAADHIANAIEEHGLPEDAVHEVVPFYRRAEGETPQQAWDRAVDRWAEKTEKDALDYLNKFDEADQNFDMLHEDTKNHPLKDAFDLLNDHYTGGKVDHDAIPFGEPSARGADAGRGGEAPQVERPAGERAGDQAGGGRQHVEGDRATDLGPDGKRQEVIPGAERITDRELAERQGRQPLKGGDAPPPKGGLFDEDARNQSDMFDGSKFGANPFFDPKVWKWFGEKGLGFNAQWRREISRLISDFRRVKEDSGKKTNAAADIGRLMFYSDDAVLRSLADKYESPTIKALADDLFAPADMGRGGAVKETYTEAVQRRSGSNINELVKIMAPFDGKPAVIDQIVKLVQNPSGIRAGTAVHDAAAALRKILDDEHKYLNDAGVKTAYVKGYYPRELDSMKVLGNQEGFKAAAERAYRSSGLDNAAARDAAQSWLERVSLGALNVKADGTDFVRLGATPARDFAKGRVLSKAADDIMAPFYHRDPLEALMVHFQRTARRAEWARRMGDDLDKWKERKQAIIDEGNAAALPQVVDSVAAATGARPPTVPQSVQSAVSWVRTWGVLGLLPRATVTSLSEVLMPSIRSGSPGRALSDLARTGAALFNMSKKLGEQREFAEDLGLIMRGSDAGILAARFNATNPSSRLQERTLNRFFRATGLEQWTAATRVVAVNAAETFIRRLALDVDGGKSRANSSRSLLRELGVADTDGFSKWVASQAKDTKVARSEEGGHADAYRAAVVRFSNQSILAPSQSTSPRWAKHPVGQMVFLLNSYNYAFQKNVLNRALGGVREAAATGKDYSLGDRARFLAPFAMLPGMVAMQLAIAPIRDEVFGSSGKQTQTPDEKWNQYVMQALSRSVTGAWDPIVNSITAAKYHRSVSEQFVGPVLSGPVHALDALIGLSPNVNSDKTNTAERNAARAVYQSIIAPGAAAVGSLLPGPLGAAATQAAGVGAVRDAFVDTVGGDPEAAGGRHRMQRPTRHQK